MEVGDGFGYLVEADDESQPLLCVCVCESEREREREEERSIWEHSPFWGIRSRFWGLGASYLISPAFSFSFSFLDQLVSWAHGCTS